jgi:hypothetical protein
MDPITAVAVVGAVFAVGGALGSIFRQQLEPVVNGLKKRLHIHAKPKVDEHDPDHAAAVDGAGSR